ncbi:hypothetical protein TIFTF001_022325 [Ficus carica]|uniref:Uncharacterized protein n=1 Tax=Ficus carica TaxID=3494 RepID=A0AA88AJR3_FICCA|nr:hypothetical protein TIFTF001_022325 [Ficus carica]
MTMSSGARSSSSSWRSQTSCGTKDGNGDDGDLVGEDEDATRRMKIATLACRIAHDVEFFSPRRLRISSVDCTSDRPPDARWKVREGGEEWRKVAEELDAGGVRRESSVILPAFVRGVVVGVEEKGGGQGWSGLGFGKGSGSRSSFKYEVKIRDGDWELDSGQGSGSDFGIWVGVGFHDQGRGQDGGLGRGVLGQGSDLVSGFGVRVGVEFQGNLVSEWGRVFGTWVKLGFEMGVRVGFWGGVWVGFQDECWGRLQPTS